MERQDLAFNSAGNYESMFTEIKFKRKKNHIVGYIYRYQTSEISLEDSNRMIIEPLLEKINRK